MLEEDIKDLNVLVVEDSPTQALFLQESLEEFHIHARIAIDGLEALQEIKRSLPDVIISDIQMPRMDGYELCKRVKEEFAPKNIPVILLTSLSDPMDVIRGMESGGDSFLTKPCQINFLLSTIWDVIKNNQLNRETSLKRQLEFFFQGKHHSIQTNHEQISGLLLSTYSNAIQKNLELEKAYSKLNQVYEELKQKNQELKKLNQQKNQFLGMAAHDLRNPLGVITEYSRLLIMTLEGKTDEKSLKMLTRIKASSALMLDLVNDFLDISVIESGIVSLRLSSVDFPNLVQENLSILKPLADKKGVYLSFKCPSDTPTVNCDPSKIIQVLNNLVTNAIKFSYPGQTIDIEVIPHEKKLELQVRDQGMGIAPEFKERLFQPLSKGGLAGTAGEKGTGLGLVIAHKIIEAHKGSIQVESKVGEGSVFLVTLPYEPEIF